MAVVKGRSFADAVAGRKSAEEVTLEYIMDFCMAVYEKMVEEGINKVDLAKMIGKTPSHVSRVLSGEANITLATMAEIDAALGLGIRIKPVGSASGKTSARIEGAPHQRAEKWSVDSDIRLLERV